MDVRKIMDYIPAILIVSCYFFPFEFTFLPKGINTKMMLAVLGLVFMYFHYLKVRYVSIDRKLIPAFLIVILFCLTGFIAVDYNNTDDYSYALYVFSFATWLGGAYAVYSILKCCHKNVTFKILINYLIAVCIMQCVLALAIDLIEPLKHFVNAYISQETIAKDEFLENVKRLYGIGAALDVAGTRFSVVLLGLSVLVCNDVEIKSSRIKIAVYLFAFIFICAVGNIISRTTLIGMVMAIAYFVYKTTNIVQIKKEDISFWIVVLTVGCIMFFIIAYFYNSDQYFHEHIRYGFEGFFNWIECGEWRTDSTDKLNTMWMWPTDLKTWFLGTGVFDKFEGTDIGYCRFVLYSGIPGLFIFSMFFVYNAVACMRKLGPYKDFCIGILILGFIIWVKVATDLFIIYALLYCIDQEKEEYV